MDTLKGLTLASATLSMLGSGFIIFSYFYFAQLRTMVYKMIVSPRLPLRPSPPRRRVTRGAARRPACRSPT